MRDRHVNHAITHHAIQEDFALKPSRPFYNDASMSAAVYPVSCTATSAVRRWSSNCCARNGSIPSGTSPPNRMWTVRSKRLMRRFFARTRACCCRQTMRCSAPTNFSKKAAAIGVRWFRPSTLGGIPFAVADGRAYAFSRPNGAAHSKSITEWNGGGFLWWLYSRMFREGGQYVDD